MSSIISGILGFFEDEKLTLPVDFFNFGVVDAGSKSTKTIYMTNRSEDTEIEGLKFIVGDPDLTIEPSTVKTLPPKATVKLELTWHPSRNRVEPLQCKIYVSAKIIKKPKK